MSATSVREASLRTTLQDAYERLLATLAATPEEQGWQPTGCAGWTVRDLVHHLLSDAQRALVALHTPADGLATIDGITYWTTSDPGSDCEPQHAARPAEADQNLRATRIMASAWTRLSSLVDLYAETARAALVAAGERSGDVVVLTQGRRLTVDSLLSTLVVEATVHHLDLRLGEPGAAGLAEVRRVLDGLLGTPAPLTDDVRYALVGFGREALSRYERDQLAVLAERFPLLG